MIAASPPQAPKGDTSILASLSRAAAATTPILIVAIFSITLNATLLLWMLLRAEEPIPVRVAFVKLHPNGSYHVSYNDTEQPFSLFQSTIDSLLRKAITSRLRFNPSTIQADYNAHAVFLSQFELGRFMTEFNAREKINQALECQSNCVRIEPAIQAIQHLNYVSTDIDTLASGRVVQSTAYVNLEHRAPNSQVLRTESLIIPMEWQLDPNKVAAIGDMNNLSMQVLNVNPIGLTILRFDIEEDRSAQ